MFNVNSAKKVRKHCIDEDISQYMFGVEILLNVLRPLFCALTLG